MDGLFLFLWNPVTWVLVLIGYIAMFVLAATIAPRIAGRLSGRLSLYTSMALLTVLIITVFVGTLAGIVYAYALATGTGPSLRTATEFLGSLVLPLTLFVVVSNLLVYLVSPYMINIAYHAREDPGLQEIVNSVAARLGLSRPPKAVVVEGPPNAFAYGNIVSGRHVAVTTGMLEIADRDELEAVIGHEIGHHLHRDNALMLFLGILPSVIYYLGIYLINMSMYRSGVGNRREGNGGIVLLVAGVAAVMVSFLLQILVLAFSRLREYFADTEGARAAGRYAMQKALAKIHLYYRRSYRDRAEVAESKLKTLFIYALTEAVAEPFYRVSREDIERIMKSGYSGIEEIFSTHPPIPKRLRALENLQW